MLVFYKKTHQKICGKNFKPYTNSKYNTSVLIISGIITILGTLLSILALYSKSYTIKKIIIISIAVFIVLTSITVFLSIDLAGGGTCDGKTFKCTSKLSNIDIPSNYCNYTFDCECDGSNESCPGDCICINSTCFPSVGDRKEKTIQVRNVNILNIIVSVIISILAPIIFIYMSKDFDFNINKTISIIIIILLSITPIIYTCYASFKKVDKIVYDGSCIDKKQCPTGATCDNDYITFNESSLCGCNGVRPAWSTITTFDSGSDEQCRQKCDSTPGCGIFNWIDYGPGETYCDGQLASSPNDYSDREMISRSNSTVGIKRSVVKLPQGVKTCTTLS